MSHAYYIDLENVQAKGLIGAGKISKNDTVFIFYSIHAKPRIPFDTAQEIAMSKGTFIFKEVVYLGKNAMDKEIVREARKHMEKYDNFTYHIVSKDKGFKKAFKDTKNVVYQAKIK